MQSSPVEWRQQNYSSVSYHHHCQCCYRENQICVESDIIGIIRHTSINRQDPAQHSNTMLEKEQQNNSTIHQVLCCSQHHHHLICFHNTTCCFLASVQLWLLIYLLVWRGEWVVPGQWSWVGSTETEDFILSSLASSSSRRSSDGF